MSRMDQVDTTSPQDALEEALAARFREIAALSRALLDVEAALKREREDHKATRLALKTAEYKIGRGYDAIISSTSWRITAPLRWVVRRLRRR